MLANLTDLAGFIVVIEWINSARMWSNLSFSSLQCLTNCMYMVLTSCHQYVMVNAADALATTRDDKILYGWVQAFNGPTQKLSIMTPCLIFALISWRFCRSIEGRNCHQMFLVTGIEKSICDRHSNPDPGGELTLVYTPLLDGEGPHCRLMALDTDVRSVKYKGHICRAFKQRWYAGQMILFGYTSRCIGWACTPVVGI